jgi:hypothetical protein
MLMSNYGGTAKQTIYLLDSPMKTGTVHALFAIELLFSAHSGNSTYICQINLNPRDDNICASKKKKK